MHSPLYRQEQELKQKGIELSRRTMSNWFITASRMWLEPLYDRLKEQLLKESVLHADETTLKVCGQRKSRQQPRATCGCTEQADAARGRSFSMTTDRTARRRTLKNISKTSRDIYIPTATKRIEVLMTSRSSAVGRTPEEDSVKRWRFYRKSSARIRRQLSVWITAVSCMRLKRK